jgi:7,8-dihydroneopterin aldolase/epimerase/oxygenase
MGLTVEIRGLELRGYHGVLADEARHGQRFVFDVWLEVDAEPARSDRIEDAVDYREVVGVVRELSESRRFALLEALASAVAHALVERFPVERARVCVRKPDVRLDAPVEYAAVTATASAPPRSSA